MIHDFPKDLDIMAQKCYKLFNLRNITLSVAESCTGGLFSHTITNIPGSSTFFKAGLVVYSNEAKNSIVKVLPETIEKFGAVSQETAEELAKGVQILMNSTVGVGITGIAGPGGATLKKPVGLVHISGILKDKLISRKYLFSGSRLENKIKFAEAAFQLLFELLQ